MTSLQFSIELNIDSANFRFPFSTRCTLSKKKRSIVADICKEWLGTFYFENFVDLFNKHPVNRPASIMVVYTKYGNIDWIMFGLKCLRNFYNNIPSAMSSGESWNHIFVPHRITTFLRLDMTGDSGPAIKHSELCHLLYHNLEYLEVAGTLSKHFSIYLAPLLWSLWLILF